MAKLKNRPEVTDLNKSIAWVCEVEDIGGKIELKVVRKGMSVDEIREHFPPTGGRGKHGYNRDALVRAVYWEAYKETLDGTTLPRGNTRSFMYRRFLHLFFTVLNEPTDPKTTHKIKNSINNQLTELVNWNFFSYDDLNLYSEKEDLWHVAIVENSPYPNVIVMIEKAAYFESLRDLADRFGISFCCLGGKPSNAATTEFLKDARLDTSRGFKVFSYTDFDPHGWQISASFAEQLRNGGHDVELIRVGLLREQLGKSVIDHQAIPYSMDADDEAAEKGKETTWENFEAETGGLYIPDDQGGLIPGRVEMDIFTPEQVKTAILRGLGDHLDGFEYQKERCEKIIRTRFGSAKHDALGALMDDWQDEQEPDPRREEIDAERNKLKKQIARIAQDENAQLRELYEIRHDLTREEGRRIAKLAARHTKELARLRAKHEREIVDLQARYVGDWADGWGDVGGYAEGVQRDVAERSRPVRERIDKLEEQRDKKTEWEHEQISHLDSEEADIERIESQLEDYQHAVFSNEMWDDASEAIDSIEDWREWLNRVGIDELDLSRSATLLDWEPSQSDENRIVSWLTETMCNLF